MISFLLFAGALARWGIFDELCEKTQISEYLDNWCSDLSVCSWKGVTCFDGDVVFFEIEGAPLNIEIPLSFYGPPRSVRIFKMKNCGLTGTIKDAQMLDYQEMDLSDNMLSGELPFRFTSQFKRLYLANNAFVGDPGLCTTVLTRVSVLDLSNNMFVEDLTGCTTSIWPEMVTLRISGNSFYGMAPSPYAMSVYDISDNAFFSIRSSPLKEVEDVLKLGLSKESLENQRFALCDTSGNAFTVRAPDWMKVHETRCRYSWSSQNTRFTPTITDVQGSKTTAESKAAVTKETLSKKV